MTDIVALASRLYSRIEWQSVPDDVTKEDLTALIADSIKMLYVMTGRAQEFSEDMFVMDGDLYSTFSNKLMQDEEEYVIVSAEIKFYEKVQTDVDNLVSYSTDAMSVSHGDKPFANLETKITNLTKYQRMIWYKMIRYNMI